jgi:hypothetical protein
VCWIHHLPHTLPAAEHMMDSARVTARVRFTQGNMSTVCMHAVLLTQTLSRKPPGQIHGGADLINTFMPSSSLPLAYHRCKNTAPQRPCRMQLRSLTQVTSKQHTRDRHVAGTSVACMHGGLSGMRCQTNSPCLLVRIPASDPELPQKPAFPANSQTAKGPYAAVCRQTTTLPISSTSWTCTTKSRAVHAPH